MASKKNGTLYTGLTNNLKRRVFQHKTNALEGFTKRYQVHRLVYFERFGDINAAIRREKRIKAWKRRWKIEMIEKCNPNWADLLENTDARAIFLQKQAAAQETGE